MKKLSLLKKQEISKAEMNILSGGATEGCNHWCDVIINGRVTGGLVCNASDPIDAARKLLNQLDPDIDYSAISCKKYPN